MTDPARCWLSNRSSSRSLRPAGLHGRVWRTAEYMLRLVECACTLSTGRLDGLVCGRGGQQCRRGALTGMPAKRRNAGRLEVVAYKLRRAYGHRRQGATRLFAVLPALDPSRKQSPVGFRKDVVAGNGLTPNRTDSISTTPTP